MRKIFKIILRICSFLFGCLLMFASLGGVLISFHSPNTMTIILTIAFFTSGILLIYFSLKGLKSEIQNGVSANYIVEPSCSEDTNYNTQYQNLNSSSPNTDGNRFTPTYSTIQNHSYSQQNTSEPKVEVPPTSDVYIENSDYGIRHIDNSPITDEEVPYLMQLGYERALEYENLSSNPKFHRTAQEKELSFRFSTEYGRQVHALENNFEALYRTAANEKNINQKISMLNEALDSFEHAKNFCYSKGRGGIIYFQDMWEYLHNSQKPCFSYADNIRNALNEALLERDIIIPGILNAIREKGYIMQKDLYKLLPTVERRHLQYVVQKLERDNYITKTKSGNSYELRLKN